MGTILSVVAAVLLIAANAFFVADEFALVAIDRSQVNVRAANGERPWATVSKLLGELSFHLSAAQVGITISSLIFGLLTKPLGRTLLAPVLDPLVGQDNSFWVSVTIAFVLANVLQVVMGEVVPKTLAIAEPSRVLQVIAPGIAVWGWMVRPVVTVVNGMADRIVSRLGFEPTEELSGVSTMGELEHVIRASGAGGTLDPEDVTRLTRSIRFADKSAGDILVPRVDLVVVDREDTLVDLCDAAAETGHSRFPVIGADTDDVLGVVHVKSALGVAPTERSAVMVEDRMTDAFVVPEARELDSLLDEMYSNNHHLAFVLDEHGGVAGIVTIEDIVEEILGEIDDEYDRATVDQVRQLNDREYLLAGSMHLDEITEGTGLAVPDGSYETLAGFVLDRLQRIPTAGDRCTWDGWTFEVTDMDRWRIESVKVVRPEGQTGTAGDESTMDAHP